MLQRVIESYIHANKAKALLSATRYNERIDRAVATLKRNLALHASQRAGAMEALFRSIDQGLSEDRRQVTNFWRASLANAVNGGIQDFGGSEQGGAAQLTPMDMQGQIEALRRQSGECNVSAMFHT